MWLLFSLFTGVLVGFLALGRSAVAAAVRGDMRPATHRVHGAAGVSAIVSVLAAFVFLGWPWHDEAYTATETVLVDIEKTVPQTESGWYRVLGIPLWPTEETVQVPTTFQETRTVPVKGRRSVFSIGLMILLGILAVAAYILELSTCRLAWTWIPRHWLASHT